MRIISTTDLSREGNDCYINESVTLVEQFGMYAVIICRRVSGWAEENEIYAQHVTTDYRSAVKYYQDCDGIIEERE
jgi:hypothetical protein